MLKTPSVDVERKAQYETIFCIKTILALNSYFFFLQLHKILAEIIQRVETSLEIY